MRSVDEAIRRCLHFISFTVTIPHNERDPRLGEKLLAELPGILAWAIEGCLAWQHEGLNPPLLVREATADYLAAEDAIGQWLEDRCITGGAPWTTGAALFSDYQTWSERADERAISQKRLAQALESRGFVQTRTRTARGFQGIELRVGVTHVTGSPIIPVTHARVCPISEEVSQVSRSNDKRLLEAYLKSRNDITEELVFRTPEGTILDPDNLYHRIFLPVLAKAGIRRIRLHDLRHTFGSLLLQNGASIVYAKEQMGHSSIQVTVDTYGHLIPGAKCVFRRPA